MGYTVTFKGQPVALGLTRKQAIARCLSNPELSFELDLAQKELRKIRESIARFEQHAEETYSCGREERA